MSNSIDVDFVCKRNMDKKERTLMSGYKKNRLAERRFFL